MFFTILLADTNVSGLISLYREIGGMLVGVGFLCAGLAVLKKLISNHERTTTRSRKKTAQLSA